MTSLLPASIEDSGPATRAPSASVAEQPTSAAAPPAQSHYRPIGLPPSDGKTNISASSHSSIHSLLQGPDPQTIAQSINPALLDPALTADQFTASMLDLQKTADTLATLTTSHNQLQILVKHLRTGIDTAIQSRLSSVAHLQREILSKEQRINALMSERIFLLNSMEDIKLRARDEVSVAKSNMASQTQAMEQELVRLREQYSQLAEFQHHKQRFETDYQKLVEELNAEKAAHSRDVCELERRNILEKERLKNAMLEKIKATKLSLLAQTRNAVSVTTQRTMAENNEMITELMYQSRETENMASENLRWKQEREQRDREKALNRQERNEMLSKCATYQRIIKQLQAEVHTLQKQRVMRHTPTGSEGEKVEESKDASSGSLSLVERSKESAIRAEMSRARRSVSASASVTRR